MGIIQKKHTFQNITENIRFLRFTIRVLSTELGLNLFLLKM